MFGNTLFKWITLYKVKWAIAFTKDAEIKRVYNIMIIPVSEEASGVKPRRIAHEHLVLTC
jgi:hypothetical protein